LATSSNNVEIRHLRYFVAVAEHLHFARAAESLRIAQPGLSHQIKALERFLGVALFIRDRRGVELTEAGEVLLHHARQIIELAERAVQSTQLAGLTKKEVFKVGTSAVAMLPVAKQVLGEFQHRYPQIDLEVHPGFASQTIDALSRRALDVAIVFAPFQSRRGIRYVPLETAELVVALPQGHRLASLERVPRAELLKEPLLEGPRHANPSVTDDIHQSLFGEVEHPRLLQLADVSEGTRLQLVADGKGVTLSVLSLVGRQQVPGIVFRRIAEPTPTIECGVAWFDAHPSPLIESFLQVAGDVAEAPMTEAAE
jgi:DNA-binding transcriptional LysR family regulator